MQGGTEEDMCSPPPSPAPAGCKSSKSTAVINLVSPQKPVTNSQPVSSTPHPHTSQTDDAATTSAAMSGRTSVDFKCGKVKATLDLTTLTVTGYLKYNSDGSLSAVKRNTSGSHRMEGLKPADFEAAAGLGRSRRWRDSFKVKGVAIGKWASAKGIDLHSKRANPTTLLLPADTPAAAAQPKASSKRARVRNSSSHGSAAQSQHQAPAGGSSASHAASAPATPAAPAVGSTSKFVALAAIPSGTSTIKQLRTANPNLRTHAGQRAAGVFKGTSAMVQDIWYQVPSDFSAPASAQCHGCRAKGPFQMAKITTHELPVAGGSGQAPTLTMKYGCGRCAK